MKRSQSGYGTNFMIFMSLVLIFYLSYRYPFQINFSGTSPTYSDTPLALQVGKFIIAMFGCSYLALRYRTAPVSHQGFSFSVAVSFLLLFAILKAATGEIEFLEFAFWPLVALISCLFVKKLKIESLDRGIKYLLLISAVAEFAQLYLFFFHGRLPALAFDNSVSVRFGSFLDDPNGFAGLCFLFLGWAVYQSGTWKRLLLCALAVLLILISQSLTAIAFLVMVLAVFAVVAARRSPLSLIAVLVLIGLVVGTGWDDIGAALHVVYESKQGSIEEHASFQLSDMVNEGALQLLIGSFEYQFYESWWAQAVHNYGLVWTVLLIAICVYSAAQLFHSYRRATCSRDRGVALALLLYVGFFVVGSLNLPFFLIFPNNYIFFVGLCLISLKRLRWTEQPHEHYLR